MNEEIDGLKAQIEGLRGQIEGLKAQIEYYKIMELAIPPHMKHRFFVRPPKADKQE